MFQIKAPHSVEPLRFKGFTLIELMVVVAMLAILASLAAPSFADAIRRQRVEGMREEMLASVALAKAEAIARGQQVLMIRATPCPQATVNTDWDCGWTVIADLNGDNALNAGEPVLHEVQGRPGTRILRDPAGITASFSRLGQPQPARIEIFPAGAGFAVSDGLILCVARSGRLRTDRGAIAC